MAMSKESQICSLLRQLLKSYEEKIEMQAINRIQELLEVIDLETLSEKIEWIPLIYETSQKQGCDRLRLFCTQTLLPGEIWEDLRGITNNSCHLIPGGLL